LVAYLMAAPRVYYAMARDGLFFKSFGEPHKKFNTPHRAILIQIFLAFLLILTGTFESIISYFFFVVVFFIALTIVGLFKIRKRKFEGYKTILFPFTPLFFLLITTLVLIMIAMRNPFQSFLGVAVVLLGIPVYHQFFNKNHK
jgi:basic amino acid/polyamine antiporter, APA family